MWMYCFYPRDAECVVFYVLMFDFVPHDEWCVSVFASVFQIDLQHEILLPAGLVPTHSDSCAFNILHFQRHIGVELI